VIGVDLGGTKLLAGAVDRQLGVHHRLSRAVAGMGQRELLDAAAEAVLQAIDQGEERAAAVGFGVPALIDPGSGSVAVGAHTPLSGIAFAQTMAERVGLPVFVDNDGNLAALAEHRAGAARGADHAIVLTLGTGIGAGLILDGRLYRGARGAAGELGHMEIDIDGEPDVDNCPGRGCAELFVSGPALEREAARLAADHPASALGRAAAEGRPLAGPLVTELAHDGDFAAIEAVTIVAQRLGIVIASLINVFNPEVVVVGGGLIAAGELLLGPARELVARRTFPFVHERLRILPARFGAEAGMIGAAALAWDGLAAGGAQGAPGAEVVA